jgi:hypothetical protein
MARATRRWLLMSAAPPGNGGNHQNLVTVFEGILLVAKKADVFLVDVEIDEPANLSLLIAKMGLQRGKAGLDLGEQLGQVVRCGLNLLRAIGVFLKGIRQ